MQSGRFPGRSKCALTVFSENARDASSSVRESRIPRCKPGELGTILNEAGLDFRNIRNIRRAKAKGVAHAGRPLLSRSLRAGRDDRHRKTGAYQAGFQKIHYHPLVIRISNSTSSLEQHTFSPKRPDHRHIRARRHHGAAPFSRAPPPAPVHASHSQSLPPCLIETPRAERISPYSLTIATARVHPADP